MATMTIWSGTALMVPRKVNSRSRSLEFQEGKKGQISDKEHQPKDYDRNKGCRQDQRSFEIRQGVNSWGNENL
jgi:hypothetical protein